MRSRLPVVLVVAALGAAVAAMPAVGRTAQRPPCTKAAIAAGLQRGLPSGGGRVREFHCAGTFAVAFVDNPRYEYTALLKARGTRWYHVDRGRYCHGSVVPRKIRRQACDSN